MTKGQGASRREVRLAKTLVILACCAAHFPFEAKAAPSMSKTAVVGYLSQFGYLPSVDPGSEETMSENDMSTAIAEFQSFAGMDVTGEMDAATTHMMSLPRCGDKDKVGGTSHGRSKRWLPFGNIWPRRDVTYKINKYTKKLNQASVDDETAKAFALWSDQTDLRFSPKSQKADIDIRFERGVHGVRDSFDGPGKVLAHALPPGKGTYIHFDDDESWIVSGNRGANYFSVAVHEIGHSLGLGHSNVKGAVMWPFIANGVRIKKLHEDDIKGIQARYGPKTKKVISSEVPKLCDNLQVDTAFISPTGDIYFFIGKHYWKLTANGLAAGYPKIIAKTWKGLPDSIDYALTKENGQTYFLKGSKYWSYVGTRMIEGYPKKITDASESRDAIDASKRASSLAVMIYCIFHNKSQ